MHKRLSIQTEAVSAAAAAQEFRQVADFIESIAASGRVTVAGEVSIEVNYMPAVLEEKEPEPVEQPA